jgi:hypothetical protein
VPRKKRRRFTQASNRSAAERMATAASIRGLTRELNVEQRLLCHRCGLFQTVWVEALHRVPAFAAGCVVRARGGN